MKSLIVVYYFSAMIGCTVISVHQEQHFYAGGNFMAMVCDECGCENFNKEVDGFYCSNCGLEQAGSSNILYDVRNDGVAELPQSYSTFVDVYERQRDSRADYIVKKRNDIELKVKMYLSDQGIVLSDPARNDLIIYLQERYQNKRMGTKRFAMDLELESRFLSNMISKDQYDDIRFSSRYRRLRG